MAVCDFNRIRDGALAYVQGLGIHTRAAALATARSDTLYATHNPAWKVEAGPLDAHEELWPILKLDPLDWPHQQTRRSADNYFQEWWLQCVLALAAKGVTSLEAERRALDACAVLVDAWMGDGSHMGINRDATGLNASWLTSGGWRTTQRSDGFVTVAQMLLTIEIRVAQASD